MAARPATRRDEAGVCGGQRVNERVRQRAEEALENYRRAKRAVDLFVELSDEVLLDFSCSRQRWPVVG